MKENPENPCRALALRYLTKRTKLVRTVRYLTLPSIALASTLVIFNPAVSPVLMPTGSCVILFRGICSPFAKIPLESFHYRQTRSENGWLQRRATVTTHRTPKLANRTQRHNRCSLILRGLLRHISVILNYEQA